MKLTDAARKAVWDRMRAGPFRLGDLHKAATTAGMGVGSYAAVDQVLKSLRGKGAVRFDGPRNRYGHWTLLPDEEWRPKVPPPPVVAPVVVGPYDPPPALEGPNSGLTEAFADHLWCALGGGDRMRKLKDNVSVMEAHGWRQAAEEALTFLFRLGMVGPGGPVECLAPGWSYAWVYDCNNWEIVDGDGGGVALVLNDRDVPMMLAAPGMASAIRSVAARFHERGGIKRSDIEALIAALPIETPPEEKTE